MMMNVKIWKNKKFAPMFGIGLLMLSVFSSCLKNNNYNTPFSTVGASVDLPLAAANSNGLVSFSYSASPSADFPVYINLASPNTLGAAVTATFALDTAYLNSYNASNSTDFQLMPDSDYTILNGWARSIPAGQRLDSMYVMYNFDKMDLSVRYILPITIQNASVPIEQWNHLLINPQVKNKYDGEYDLIIKTVGWGAFGIADGPPALDYGSLGMVTNGNSGLVFNTVSQPAFTSAGDPTSFGATNPQLTFDLVTNLLIRVTNLAPDDGRGRMFQIDSTITTSRWDPVTKNIYAAYLMFQNGRPTQYIYDTLLYQGPRP